jgi:hypothetical protein
MPYSNSKKNDIFTSYAHDDDTAGWVKDFGKLLKKKLEQQIKIEENGREVDVKVFTDASLPPCGALPTRLQEEIMDSALLLVILSKSYLVSKWCRTEGELFIRNLRGNRELTIFIAEKNKTDRNSWPPYLKDDSGNPLLSKEFFEQTDVGRTKPILIKQGSGVFTQGADDLMEEFCQSIYEELYKQNLKKSGPPPLDIKSIRVEIRSLYRDREEAEKVLSAIKERSNIRRLGTGGKLIICPRVIHPDAKPEDIERIKKSSKGAIIVWVGNSDWVDDNAEEVFIKFNTLGRIAKCDPLPKNGMFVLPEIDMSSNSDAATRSNQIDEFFDALVAYSNQQLVT